MNVTNLIHINNNVLQAFCATGEKQFHPSSLTQNQNNFFKDANFPRQSKNRCHAHIEQMY